MEQLGACQLSAHEEFVVLGTAVLLPGISQAEIFVCATPVVGGSVVTARMI